MLITLIIVTVICIGLIIWGVATSKEDLVGMGSLFLILTVALGWGMLGSIIPIKSTTTEVVANVLQDKNVCHLSLNDVIIATHRDFATVTFLHERETVKVIETQKYNMYGTICSRAWELSKTQ